MTSDPDPRKMDGSEGERNSFCFYLFWPVY